MPLSSVMARSSGEEQATIFMLEPADEVGAEALVAAAADVAGAAVVAGAKVAASVGAEVTAVAGADVGVGMVGACGWPSTVSVTGAMVVWS